MAIANALDIQLSGATGTGTFVGSISPTITSATLNNPNFSGSLNLGTPASGTLTNCTGLSITTGVSGLGANVATFLSTPSSANLASALTTKTGTGLSVFNVSPSLTTPVVTGITDGSVASSGIIGEVISATGGSVSLVAGTPVNILSISLTAGDYDVSGQIQFLPAGGSSVTATVSAINTVSATVPTSTVINASVNVLELSFATNAKQVIPAGNCVINVASPTTVYLIAAADFAAGTVTCSGAIFARRVR